MTESPTDRSGSLEFVRKLANLWIETLDSSEIPARTSSEIGLMSTQFILKPSRFAKGVSNLSSDNSARLALTLIANTASTL